MRDDPLGELARNEVLALHHFFVGWFRGDLPVSAFAACEAAFAPDFAMIGPDGLLHDREDVLTRLRGAHGAFPPSFAIAVHDVTPLWSAGDAMLLGYIEQQHRDGRDTRRRSTALFLRAPAAPRGVHWRHLQETWIA
jgi:hypothetical protein